TTDSGDTGLVNWVLDLISTSDNSTAASATTDGSGNYSFTGVGRGTYRVRERVQAGWLQTSSNPAAIPAMSGTNCGAQTFVLFQSITCSGQVFQDFNGNGTQDAGDTGLPGWVVNLLNAATNSTVASTTTDAGGNYSFTGVAPGTYRVRD